MKQCSYISTICHIKRHNCHKYNEVQETYQEQNVEKKKNIRVQNVILLFKLPLYMQVIMDFVFVWQQGVRRKTML
jgi:hypothetical protein